MSNIKNLSSPEERGKRLKIIRRVSNLTLHEISSKYGLGVSTVKYWECAKNHGLSSKGAKRIIEAMQQEGINCSYIWLMHGLGLPPQFVDKQAKKLEDTTINMEQTIYENEKSMALEMAIFQEQVVNAITLTIPDDGMEPWYGMGSVVGGRRLVSLDMLKGLGKICIVETSDGQILCRKVMRSSSQNTFNLCCTNPLTVVDIPNLYDVKLGSLAIISRVWNRINFD